jgi:hypothetical protein
MNRQIVWQSTLDDRYEVVVVRVAPYQGLLTILDAGEEIFSRQVGLMYNAQFGPDMDDVTDWQEIVVNFIDNKKF